MGKGGGLLVYIFNATVFCCNECKHTHCHGNKRSNISSSFYFKNGFQLSSATDSSKWTRLTFKSRFGITRKIKKMAKLLSCQTGGRTSLSLVQLYHYYIFITHHYMLIFWEAYLFLLCACEGQPILFTMCKKLQNLLHVFQDCNLLKTGRMMLGQFWLPINQFLL